MILSELKEYLSANRIVSMDMLIKHFAVGKEVIDELLAVWIRKGNVRKIEVTDGNSPKCAKYYPSPAELYEWIDMTTN